MSLTAGSLFAGPDKSEMAVMVADRLAGICWIMGKVTGTPVSESTQALFLRVLLNL
jgi:hypothetical protein